MIARSDPDGERPVHKGRSTAAKSCALRRRKSAIPLLAALVIYSAGAGSALAGMTYQLDAVQALPGAMIRVKGVLFNDTDSTLNWTPPRSLVLQWRSADGRVIRSLAELETIANTVNLPVNNFVAFAWKAIVPTGVTGLTAVNVEGEPTMMALDASDSNTSLVAGSPAATPVVDAGQAAQGQSFDPALPPSAVSGTGANVAVGPAIVPTTQAVAAPSAFDNFRNHFSTYEPTYFDIGGHDGLNARFQVSFKYQLSTPKDPENPKFVDNLYLGYTQTALWDLEGDSMPFVDTSYNPSLFWKKDRLWQSPEDPLYVGLNTGVEHLSNGKSSDDSRSLNDVYIQPALNYRFSGGSTLSFAPRIKSYFSESDGQNYSDYAGYVDWRMRWAKDNGLVLTGLYRQGKEGRTTTQIEAAWPLKRTFLDMNGWLHVQFFKGYGETLLGYNHKSDSQVRIGIALAP